MRRGDTHIRKLGEEQEYRADDDASCKCPLAKASDHTPLPQSIDFTRSSINLMHPEPGTKRRTPTNRPK